MRTFLIRYLPPLLAFVCACSTQSCKMLVKQPRPPTEREVVGVWVGEDDLTYFRLDLQPAGKGACAYAHLQEPACLLRVREWKLVARKIQISLVPIDYDINGIVELSGLAAGTVMDLTVAGRGWHTKIHFRREQQMEAWAASTKKRMEAAPSR